MNAKPTNQSQRERMDRARPCLVARAKAADMKDIAAIIEDRQPCDVPSWLALDAIADAMEGKTNV